MVKNYLLDIIIVNWNSGLLLEKCIRSIYDTTNEVEFKIIIVDNNSTDDSIKNLPIGRREIIITSNINLGFAKACNFGAGNSDSDFILFLNPDTVIRGNVIKSAINFLVSSPYVGILGVRQESETGKLLPSCSRFLRAKNLIYDIFGLSKLYPGKLKPATIMTDWDHKTSSVVDQVMGSFMLLRRADFVNLGGFDEQFFVYYEDMDLARRMLGLGKYSYYLSSIAIIHSGWGTSRSIMDKRLFYSLSSRIKYSRKHLDKIEACIITLITLLPESIIRIIYSVFIQCSIANALSTIKGYKLLTGWMLKGR